MPSQNLAGVLPVFQTPFNEDETIDTGVLRTEIQWLFDCGADGVVMAMVSEVLRLSETERKTVAKLACDAVASRGPVVISVGAESGKLAEDYARHAVDVGATAVMAIPPISIAGLEEEVLRYFERILRTVTIPLIVQDASGYVGRPLSIKTQARLLNEWGADRVYFKPEAVPIGPKLTELRTATAGLARVFEGSGGISLVDSYRRGIVGTMPGADLIKGIVALWAALKRNDESAIYALSLPISAIISVQNSLDAFLAIEKYLLVKQKIFRNTIVRGPVGFVLDKETRDEVDRLFNLMTDGLQRSG